MVSPVIHDRRVEGPYLFLGVVAQSVDGPGWECRMAYAQPIASPQLPIPVESDYERQALLSLAQLVRDLRSDKELQEALGGVGGVELQKPLFPIRVHEGLCLPDVLLTVTRPGGPVPVSPTIPSTTATRCATSSRSWGSTTRNTRSRRKRPTAGWSGSDG